MPTCPVVDLRAPGGPERFRALLAERAPAPKPDAELAGLVSAILRDVAERGLSAGLEVARRFDAPTLELGAMVVGPEEMRAAELPERFRDAIKTSAARVRAFHEGQLAAVTAGMQKAPGRGWRWAIPARKSGPTGTEGQRLIPLRRVGVYVPGGKAEYPSSVIMNAVPALVAGVDEVVVCTPARKDGSLPPAVLAAAAEVGVSAIVKVGGAAAVGLMAHGSAEPSFEPVDKLVGPGNRFVNEAKRQLWGRVGLDTYAGPSEVCVAVDETANPEWAAADWLSQIEHAEDNRGWLVATSKEVAEAVLAEVERQTAGAPREAILRAALTGQGMAVVVPDEEAMATTIDALAPEHLSLILRDPERVAAMVRNAGCVLLGDYTPQSAGDFVSGPSHTLPTTQAARFGSPVNVMDFLKFQSVSCLSREDLAELAPIVEAFGEMEGFPAHGRAAGLRFRQG